MAFTPDELECLLLDAQDSSAPGAEVLAAAARSVKLQWGPHYGAMVLAD